MSNRGFTLIEVLVAFFLFMLLLAGVLGLVQIAVQGQRKSLERQRAIQETEFAVEYISRAMRGAQKDETGSCLTSAQSSGCLIGPGAGWTFDTIVPLACFPRQLVRFLDSSNRCREFRKTASESLEERISTDDTAAGLASQPWYRLISDDFDTEGFSIYEYGLYEGDGSTLDYVQPFITFSLRVTDKLPSAQRYLEVQLQTSITTRTLDVP